MKKILIALFLFAVLINSVNSEQNFTLLDYFNGDYFVYTKNHLTENSICLGSLYVSNNVECGLEMQGESMKIENSQPIVAINKLNAKILKTEYIESGASVIYAYTSKIGKSVLVDNDKVNIQIAVYDDYYIIGWPLILGSF